MLHLSCAMQSHRGGSVALLEKRWADSGDWTAPLK